MSVKLIQWELLVQNKINNFTKYFFGFFLFGILCLALISEQDSIKKFGLIFSVICLPLAMINFANFIFKPDLEDGSLELLLINFAPVEIVVAKFISVFISGLLSLVINLPIIYIVFALNWQLLLLLAITMFFLLMLASSLVLVISAMQSYFRSNTNFFAILMMPLLVPSIIMAGLIIQNSNSGFIFIMIGINLIIIPTSIVFSSYLIKNIYNI